MGSTDPSTPFLHLPLDLSYHNRSQDKSYAQRVGLGDNKKLVLEVDIRT